jgi:hypothetical protein
MRARWLLLTHFSQRYPKATPVFGAADGEGTASPPTPPREPRRPPAAQLEAVWASRTGLALDLLSVRAADLPALVATRALYPAVLDTCEGNTNDDDDD